AKLYTLSLPDALPIWQRYDPTAAVAPSRVERGLGAALPQGEPVPYLARLDMTWIKSLRLQWDAVNYQWQRGVVGFNIERQRDLRSEEHTSELQSRENL